MQLWVVVFAAVVAAAAAQDQYNKGYFQYTNVKAPKEYEHGYKRGNEYHSRDHFQQNKDHRFRAKVTWDDKSGGNGEHYFEYNHAPKHGAEYKEAPAPYSPEPAPYSPVPVPYAPKADQYAPEPALYIPEPAPYVPVDE